jgi:acyl dehydratase
VGCFILKVFEHLSELVQCVGQDVVQSDWVSVTQEYIDLFAKATGDDQWIHVDVQRASKGPFGGTIAHGFLTLSLIPLMLTNSLRVQEPLTLINYGLNRVRFPAVLPVNHQVRGNFHLLESTELPNGEGVQLSWQITLTAKGLAKPVCVAEMVIRYLRAATL